MVVLNPQPNVEKERKRKDTKIMERRAKNQERKEGRDNVREKEVQEVSDIEFHMR